MIPARSLRRLRISAAAEQKGRAVDGVSVPPGGKGGQRADDGLLDIRLRDDRFHLRRLRLPYRGGKAVPLCGVGKIALRLIQKRLPVAQPVDGRAELVPLLRVGQALRLPARRALWDGRSASRSRRAGVANGAEWCSRRCTGLLRRSQELIFRHVLEKARSQP